MAVPNGDERALIPVSRRSSLQDSIVQAEIRRQLLEPGLLLLKVLHPLCLINLRASKLMAPAVLRHLVHADRPDDLTNRNILRYQHIDFPHLADDIFPELPFL